VELSPRIANRIARDFPGRRTAQVIELLTTLDPPLHHSPDGDERVCGAILIVAHGDIDRLVAAVADAERDWRDVLVAAGLENDDWPERLADALAPIDRS
jgi:hypothetical protein